MSDIKTLVNGILANRNGIRTKLIELGLLTSPTANLTQCREAIETTTSVNGSGSDGNSGNSGNTGNSGSSDSFPINDIKGKLTQLGIDISSNESIKQGILNIQNYQTVSTPVELNRLSQSSNSVTASGAPKGMYGPNTQFFIPIESTSSGSSGGSGSGATSDSDLNAIHGLCTVENDYTLSFVIPAKYSSKLASGSSYHNSIYVWADLDSDVTSSVMSSNYPNGYAQVLLRLELYTFNTSTGVYNSTKSGFGCVIPNVANKYISGQLYTWNSQSVSEGTKITYTLVNSSNQTNLDNVYPSGNRGFPKLLSDSHGIYRFMIPLYRLS